MSPATAQPPFRPGPGAGLQQTRLWPPSGRHHRDLLSQSLLCRQPERHGAQAEPLPGPPRHHPASCHGGQGSDLCAGQRPRHRAGCQSLPLGKKLPPGTDPGLACAALCRRAGPQVNHFHRPRQRKNRLSPHPAAVRTDRPPEYTLIPAAGADGPYLWRNR